MIIFDNKISNCLTTTNIIFQLQLKKKTISSSVDYSLLFLVAKALLRKGHAVIQLVTIY